METINNTARRTVCCRLILGNFSRGTESLVKSVVGNVDERSLLSRIVDQIADTTIFNVLCAENSVLNIKIILFSRAYGCNGGECDPREVAETTDLVKKAGWRYRWCIIGTRYLMVVTGGVRLCAGAGSKVMWCK